MNGWTPLIALAFLSSLHRHQRFHSLLAWENTGDASTSAGMMAFHRTLTHGPNRGKRWQKQTVMHFWYCYRHSLYTIYIYIYIYLYHITQYTQPSTLSRGLHLREIPTWHFFANSKSAIQNPNGFVWAKRKKERTEEKRTRLRPHSMAAGVCETPLSSLVFSSSNWSTPCLLISRNNSTILEYSWSKSKSKFQPCCKKLAACWYRYLVVLGSKMVEALSFCIFAFSDLQYLKLWIVFRLSWWDGSTLNRWTCVPVLEEITQERLFPRVWVDAENVIAPQNNYRGIMYLHEDWPTPNPWTQSPKQSGSSSCGHSHFAPWTHDIANDNYSLVLGCFISLGKHNNKTTNIRVHTFD